MAKTGFWLRGAKGKLDGTTLYRTSTGTVMRVINNSPKNPKTSAQMIQRATIASVVKFYKEAVANFYKFAFQTKKTGESDYNAFVRMNMENAVALAYAPCKSSFYPAIGRDFIMSDGSLNEIPVAYNASNIPTATISGVTTADTTVGALSERLIAAGIAIEGDIITAVVYRSHLKSINDIPLQKPSWHMAQFIVDTESEIPLGSADDMTEGLSAVAGGLALGAADASYACAATLILSRKTGSGLEVSPATMHGNSVWNAIVEQLDAPAYRQRVAISWGATGNAILQGGLVQ